MESVPDSQNRRAWRACLLCGIVKTKDQFRRDGCDNCEEVLELKSSPERIAECTSAQFDGVIAMLNPPASWVAKWQRCDKFTKGIYAIRVSGRLPEDVVDDMQRAGINYRPRDGSAAE